MPKFLEDPFKKVSYSFRIEEHLLNKVKLYAKATNRKLPETFNYLIRQSLKNCNLDNTYLNEFEGTIINITYITPAYNEYGEILELGYTRGSTDYLNLNNEGFLYEVKKIPNNLDVWEDERGYYSKYADILHEGVSVVIVPEIVYNDYFKFSEAYIMDCLKYIYFTLDIQGNLKVRQISYKEAFRKLKEAGNNEVLFNFKNIYNNVKDFAQDFITEYYKVPNPNVDDFTDTLYSHLLEFANTYNEGNINSLDNMKPILNTKDLKLSTNYISEEKDLNSIIEDLQNQINEKDKAIKEYEDLTKELESKYKNLDKRLEELEGNKPKKVKRRPRKAP